MVRPTHLIVHHVGFRDNAAACTSIRAVDPLVRSIHQRTASACCHLSRDFKGAEANGGKGLNGTVSEIIGLFASIVVLAGITVAIVNGRKTALIIQRTGNVFVKSIRVATQQ